MNFLEKIRNLPEKRRKIILWSVMVVVAGLLIFFFVKSVGNKFSNFNAQELKNGLGIPELQEKMQELPKVEIPDINLEIPTNSTEEASTTEEESVVIPVE
jgi:hypothetical protein